MSILRKLLRAFLIIPRDALALLEGIVRHWPGYSGFRVRRLYYRLRLKHLGRNVFISTGVRFYGHRHISIDDNTHIDLDCILIAGPPKPFQEPNELRQIPNPHFTLAPGELHVGKNIHIAPRCLINAIGGVQIGDNSGCTSGTFIFSITTHYASFGDRSRRVLFTNRADPRAYAIGPVVLGQNTGVALNSVLLPGATVHDESFIMIGSVVRGEIPPNTIAGGNPAKPIKARFATPKPPPDSEEC